MARHNIWMRVFLLTGWFLTGGPWSTGESSGVSPVFCAFSQTTAQNPSGEQQITYKISGKVSSRQGKPVPGANIFIKGTVEGTSSDENGAFLFETRISGDTLLLVRYIGMSDLLVPVRIDRNITGLHLRLEEKATAVDEVFIAAGQDFSTLDAGQAILLRTMDIETTAGSGGEVGGALLTLPGVQAIGHDAALFVRGGSREESKTMIDGLEITHPYFTGIPDIAQKNRFSPHLFKGITFNTGGYSALYGDALSSVLALNTRDHPGKTSSVLAFMPYGVQVGHDYQAKNGHTSFGIDLGYSNFGPYYRLIRHRTDWIDAPENKLLNANFRQQIGKTGFLKWYGYANLSDQKAHMPDLESPGNTFPLRVENGNMVSLLTYTQQLSERWQFYLGHGYNANRDRTSQATETSVIDEQQQQLRANLQGSVHPALLLNIGTEAFHNQWNQGRTGQTGGPGRAETWTRLDAWADATYRPLEAFSVNAGLRSAWNSRLGDGLLVMPRASLTYHAGPNSVSASAGAYAQQPEPFYARQPDTALLYSPDWFQSSLRHTHVSHYQFYYQRKTFGKLLRAELYYKDYRQLIMIQRGGPLGERVYNGGKGYAQGLDLFWKDHASVKGLDYWISYSYLHSKRQYLDYPVMARPTFAAPHTLHLVGKQFIEPLGFFVGASYSLSAGRPYYNPRSAVFLSDRLPVYQQLNFNMALLRKWGNTFHTMVLAVNNLTGREQVFDYRFSQDGSNRQTIGLPYKRGWMLGWFISIGQDRSDEILSQLP